ncbi:hypothetical protein F5878DRAFT_667037 [Lentinula raphanica]|uniref:Uncharacterized protein n=1 Tax=Lentinula raphanica TaxID=153919 RepID=A0AA38U481_9AGAR|nr:hypothetical protein F5878DRAFT_667037 [Lentinula raphanica]
MSTMALSCLLDSLAVDDSMLSLHLLAYDVDFVLTSSKLLDFESAVLNTSSISMNLSMLNLQVDLKARHKTPNPSGLGRNGRDSQRDSQFGQQ